MAKEKDKLKNYVGPVHTYRGIRDDLTLHLSVIPGHSHSDAWSKVMSFVRN